MKTANMKTAGRRLPNQETAALLAIANAINRLAAAAEIIASPPIASSSPPQVEPKIVRAAIYKEP
jgi:hypothetical protein